jgi:hypothetical protein
VQYCRVIVILPDPAAHPNAKRHRADVGHGWDIVKIANRNVPGIALFRTDRKSLERP